MGEQTKRYLPEALNGPTSYFTDLDYRRADFSLDEVERRLKLQLLTKERVVVAASSLFHEAGYGLVSRDEGLVQALEQGIVLPAIRDRFGGVDGFFENKNEGYPKASRAFFSSHIGGFVPWSLRENTEWFRRSFYAQLQRPESVVRRQLGLSDQAVTELVSSLEAAIEKEPEAERFLRREHIERESARYCEVTSRYLNDYATLIYRISGSRVVNSEPHFPQGNLVRSGITGVDHLVSDEEVFWDIYVEALVTYLNSVTRLTPERLERLSFKDVLELRRSAFDGEFAARYDALIGKAKAAVDMEDPDRLVLHQEELFEAARRLRREFDERIGLEQRFRCDGERETGLWAMANALALLSAPAVGLVVGAVSALQVIPEMTAPFSPRIAEELARRREWVRQYVNSRVGWSREQRATLIEGYRKLLNYGFEL